MSNKAAGSGSLAGLSYAVKATVKARAKAATVDHLARHAGHIAIAAVTVAEIAAHAAAVAADHADAADGPAAVAAADREEVKAAAVAKGRAIDPAAAAVGIVSRETNVN